MNTFVKLSDGMLNMSNVTRVFDRGEAFQLDVTTVAGFWCLFGDDRKAVLAWCAEHGWEMPR